MKKEFNILEENLGGNSEVITDDLRSIISFYRANKTIITLKEKEFKDWVESNYLAIRKNGKFIATSFSVENGYMVNCREVIINLDENLKCIISYSAKVTKKGQEYILNCFKEANSNEQ